MIETILLQLMRLIEQFGEWLPHAPRDEALATRVTLVLAPALIGAVLGAFAISWLSGRTQRALVKFSATARALEEIAWPMLEAIRQATPMESYQGSGTAGAANVRFGAIRQQWEVVGSLLRHPLGRYLPTSVTAAARSWHKAENSLQAIWETAGTQAGPAERTAFALLLDDPERDLTRLPRTTIERGIYVMYPSRPDELNETVVAAVLDATSSFPTARRDATEWREGKSEAIQSRHRAIEELTLALDAGPH